MQPEREARARDRSRRRRRRVRGENWTEENTFDDFSIASQPSETALRSYSTTESLEIEFPLG